MSFLGISPLDVARRLGNSIADSIGADALVELELSFAAQLLPKFSDNQLIRMRQHILLYWDPSYFKSTLIDEFSKTVPVCMNIVNISSMTPETLFGSISDDRQNIVKPVLAIARFAKIDELLSFLGSSNTMKDIVNTLNTAMEGKKVTRHLLKLGQPEFDPDKILQLKKENVEYDPFNAQLSHQPDITIWAASRPMDNRTYTYLRTAGHLGRFHVIQYEISDEQAERFFTKHLCPDMKLQEDLKILNQRLSIVVLKKVNFPNSNVLSQIMSPLKEIVKEETSDDKQRLAQVIDIRTQGDIIRELAAHALLRTATENDFKNIDKLEYTQADIEFILKNPRHFVESKINPLFTDEFTERKQRKKRPRDQVKELVLQFLSDGKNSQRKEIDGYVNSRIKVGPATISNAFEELVNEGKISQPKYGFYATSQSR
jgi:hypothetical protein